VTSQPGTSAISSGGAGTVDPTAIPRARARTVTKKTPTSAPAIGNPDSDAVTRTATTPRSTGTAPRN